MSNSAAKSTVLADGYLGHLVLLSRLGEMYRICPTALLILNVEQDAVMRHPTTVQAARAANVAYCMLQYRRLLEREELEPVRNDLNVKFCLVKLIAASRHMITLPHGFCCG
jgi:hypothetical protein